MHVGPRVLRAAIAALSLLLVACNLSVTPIPVASDPASQTPTVTAGRAAEACERDPFGCAAVAVGDPIRVGTALTLSGPTASLGLDSQFGAQVALNLRGPVAGHEVELVNEDDGCSSEGGTEAASRLVELDALVGVIGTSCSSAAEPAADILGSSGVLLLSPSNTAPRLTDADASRPFYARLATSDVAQGRAMAQFVCGEVGLRTAATLQDGSAHAAAVEEAFASEFASACDGELTERATAGGDRATVDAALSRIATSNDGRPPELMYVPVAGQDATLIARRARRATGLEDTILAGLRLGEDGSAIPGLTDGMFLSAPLLVPSGDFYETVFLAEYRNASATDEPIAPFHAYAYDAVNMLLDAVEAVAVEEDGTLYVPRSALRDQLLGTQGYDGLGGTFSCRPTGDCGAGTIAIWLVDEGALEQVWP